MTDNTDKGGDARLALTVAAIETQTPDIRSVILKRDDGSALPGWTAGAHIDLDLPAGGTRSYSLVNLLPDAAASSQPVAYRLGVRLENPSQGGSSYMHGLKVGDRVTASMPKNHFALAEGSGEAVLLAGGIGITPIVSMAAALKAAGRRYRLIYAGRSRAHLAFLPEIEKFAEASLTVHADDVGGIFDVSALMTAMDAAASLYVCGPKPMIEAAIASAHKLGWAESRLRFEIFSTPEAMAGDTAFDVVLAQSGKRVTVPPGQTILEALIASGEDPLCDCRRGDCGLCQVGVIEGIPDHRDFYLSAKDRASNKVMQICISRSKTPLLILDL